MLRTVLLFAVFTSASAFARVNFMEIASVEVKQISDEVVKTPQATPACGGMFVQNVLDIGWDEIITIGEKVWEIVEAGKPVVNVSTKNVSALPIGLNCWTDLDGWQAPRARTYEVLYKNLLGMQVVTFRFRVQYTAGGGKGGVGKYLANVTIVPAQLDVMWGYTFNAEVQALPAVNIGTQNDPIAGLEMSLKWSVNTPLKDSQNSLDFFMQGDGQIKGLN